MTLFKILCLLFGLIGIFIISQMAFAKHKEPHAQSILVLDMRNALELPRNFRTTSDDLSKKPEINQEGLAKLYVAGGGQFSKLALQKILERLHAKHITIIDLRQESHGFLNGNAISWYGPSDADNAGKTSEQIQKDQEALLMKLSKEENATVHVILQKTEDLKIADTKPIEFAVHQTSTESEIAEDFHLRYRRIYVQDFNAPTPREVDRFIRMVNELPENEWIYFHCRAGIGRTTTFMAMFDMLFNAKKVSFKDILARQKALGGKDLMELPRESSYKFQSSQARLKFLNHFYQYVQENENNFQTPWSEWIKTISL